MEHTHIPKYCAFCGNEADRWFPLENKESLYFCTDCCADADDGEAALLLKSLSEDGGMQLLKKETGVYSCSEECPICNQ